MKLIDLEHLQTYSLPAGQSLFRVQRPGATGKAVARGPFNLAPPGTLSGRFDLPRAPTAYLAEAPDTALFEAVFRRDSTGVSIAGLLAQRELIAVQLLADLALGDLRPHAPTWPVLQSLRSSETQELAQDLHQAGFAGLAYRSAQHHGHDCFVLFDPPAGTARLLWHTRLANATGSVNRWAADAVRRSRVPLMP